MVKKHCSRCGKYKPPDEYHERADRPGTLRSACKECVNAPHRKRKPPETRFWTKYRDKTRKVGDCLEWTGSYRNKYPSVGWKGKTALVRRLVYQLAIGALSDDEFVLDTCGNRRCVRHSHLVKGTKDDLEIKRVNHAATGDRHGSQTHPERVPRGDEHTIHLHPERLNPRRGSQHGQAKLTEDAIPIIRRLATEGIAGAKIAARFDVSPGTIYSVLRGKTWGHIPDESRPRTSES